MRFNSTPLVWCLLLVACSEDLPPREQVPPYEITEKRDLGGGQRFRIHVKVPEHYEEMKVRAVTKDIARQFADGVQVSVFMFGPHQETNGGYDVAMATRKRDGSLEVDCKPKVARSEQSSLVASDTTSLFQIHIPRGSKLVTSRKSGPNQDAKEEFKIDATADEIMGFFRREMIRSGWLFSGADEDPSGRFFKKDNALVLVIAGREGGSFSISGSARFGGSR